MFSKIIMMLGIVTFVVGIAVLLILSSQKQRHHTTKTPVQTTIEDSLESQSPPPTTPATLLIQEVFVNGPIQLCTMKDNTNDKEYIIIVGNTGVTITPRIPKGN